MFTDKERYLVIDAIRAAKRLHLVTHTSPDKDGLGSNFIAMMKSKKHASEVILHFVPHGEMLDFATMDPMQIPGPNDVVLHSDTGGMIKVDVEHSDYEPAVLVIDHHFDGCPFHSATGIMLDLLHPKTGHPAPKYARDMAAFVDRTDSGNKVGALSDEAHEEIAALNELMDEQDGRRIGRFVANHPGPINLSKVIHNQAPWVTDEEHMRNLLYSLEAEVYGGTKFHEMLDLHKASTPLNVGGLHVLVMPKSIHDPKDIRSFLNTKFHNDVDVFLSEVDPSSRAYIKGAFGIAILSGKDDMVDGMVDAHRALQERFPGNKIYLHEDHFVIYVKPPIGDITLSDVLEAVNDNLRRKTDQSQGGPANA